MASKIEDLEGVGSHYGRILREYGINSPKKLLEAGCTRQGRQDLAAKTGIDEARLLKWVNLCDLCRISGVSTQYSELLEAAGVDTVKELRNRNADNLASKIQEINGEKRLVRQPPNLKSVSKWIQQAKELDPLVSH
jgi:predicted flap endonuclease-1-like 5' DNA nuclease